MRIYKHIITILVLANMFLMFACTNDMDISQPVEPGLEDKVSISLFTRAQDYSIPVTRGGANETGIEKTPYVLVFKGRRSTLEGNISGSRNVMYRFCLPASHNCLPEFFCV